MASSNVRHEQTSMGAHGTHRQQRRIPSFKLNEDENACSKRFKKKIPSFRLAKGGARNETVDDIDVQERLDERKASFSLNSSAGSDIDECSVWVPGDISRRNDSFTLEDHPYLDARGAACPPPYLEVLDDTSFNESSFWSGEGDILKESEGDLLPEGEGADLPCEAPFQEMVKDEISSTLGSSSRGEGVKNRVPVPQEGSPLDPEKRLPSFSLPMEYLINEECGVGDDNTGDSSLDLFESESVTPVTTQGDDHAEWASSDGMADLGLGLGESITPFAELCLFKGGLAATNHPPASGEKPTLDVPRAVAKRRSLAKKPPAGTGGSGTALKEEGKKATGMGVSSKGGGVHRPATRDTCSRRPERTDGGEAGRDTGKGVSKRQTSEEVARRLPIKVLEKFYHVPLNHAARELNVSLTMLKKLCRQYGVKRWPHRQVSSLNKTISRLQGKISTRRDGKDVPPLRKKLEQVCTKRDIIIKTASRGLEPRLLNQIFTCHLEDLDEDAILREDWPKLSLKPGTSRSCAVSDSEGEGEGEGGALEDGDDDEEEVDEGGDTEERGEEEGYKEEGDNEEGETAEEWREEAAGEMEPQALTEGILFQSRPPGFLAATAPNRSGGGGGLIEGLNLFCHNNPPPAFETGLSTDALAKIGGLDMKDLPFKKEDTEPSPETKVFYNVPKGPTPATGATRAPMSMHQPPPLLVTLPPKGTSQRLRAVEGAPKHIPGFSPGTNCTRRGKPQQGDEEAPAAGRMWNLEVESKGLSKGGLEESDPVSPPPKSGRKLIHAPRMSPAEQEHQHQQHQQRKWLQQHQHWQMQQLWYLPGQVPPHLAAMVSPIRSTPGAMRLGQALPTQVSTGQDKILGKGGASRSLDSSPQAVALGPGTEIAGSRVQGELGAELGVGLGEGGRDTLRRTGFMSYLMNGPQAHPNGERR